MRLGREQCRRQMTHALALLAAGGLALAGWPAAAENFDGTWEGDAYITGDSDCPSKAKVHVTIIDRALNGWFAEGDHPVEVAGEVQEDGRFKVTGISESGHPVRLEGKFKGDKFHGTLRASPCSGSWQLTRVVGPDDAGPQSVEKSAGPSDDLEAQLRQLQDLLARKLIDETEFKRRQKRLLDQMLAATASPAGTQSAARTAPATPAPATAGDIAYGRYHALVIGNDAYQHLPQLQTAVADAKAVAALLRNDYGFQVDLLLDANRYDITTAISRLRRELTENDNLLIYFAGHGLLDEEARSGFWLPVDAERDNDANWVANTYLSRNLLAMTAKHVLVIADSCYSGTLTRAATATLKSGQESATWLARMAEKRSRTALTSGGLEPVLDAGGGQHSVFADAFLDALREGPAVIEGSSLFAALRRPVVVNAQQTPEYADIRDAGHGGGDFLFVRR